MIEITYQNHNARRQRATALWAQIVQEYNGGKSATDIANSYINPVTGKNYTRAHIYWILKKLRD